MANADERYFATRIVPFNEGAKGRAEAERVLERLREVDGRVLDLGCGPGFTTRRLEEYGIQAVGADLARAGLDLARESGASSLVQLDSARLAVRSASFACVVMTHVLGHVASPAATLVEVRRALRPGGSVLITTPNARFVDVYRSFNERGLVPYHRDPTVLRYYRAETLERELRLAGFERVLVEPFGAAPRMPRELLSSGPEVSLADPELRERLMAVAVSPTPGPPRARPVAPE